MTGFTDLAVPGPHGPVRVRRYPAGNPRRRLVWAHGGGWSAGDLEMPESHEVARRLAADGSEVIAVDYRLVGEATRYPVPHDDVVAVLTWALEAGDLPVVAGGGSAGGNLVAGAVARLVQEGAALAGVVLAYPLLHRVVPPWGSAPNLDHLEADARFLPDRLVPLTDAFAPVASAGPWAFVGDGPVPRFPPTLIVLSEFDDLRPSGERFAAQLAEAGTEVELVVEPGTLHGHLNEPALPGFAATLRRIAQWLGTRVPR